MDRISRFLFCFLVIGLVSYLPLSEMNVAAADAGAGFEIKNFEVSGNTIMSAERLQAEVNTFTGQGKTAADVEKARDALEKLYHDAGYPAVLVNIPEQTLKDGIVNLEVIEATIGKITITGNRYFTMEKIMEELPSLAPGKMLYMPDVQDEIGRLNRNQDFKLDPVMAPGKEPGTIDVELKVKDKLPVHGYLELSNRNSHDTKPLRLNAMVRYDNLWQKEHSLSLQYQTGPQDPKEVEVLGFSYSLPAPWEKNHQLAIYGIWSDSNVATGEGFTVIGKGEIFGTRYVVPLPPYKLYAHNIILGVDFKHFNQATGFTTESGETTHTPITYLPLSFAYSSSLPDEGGTTQFSAGINMSIRGFVAREDEFELKRFKAQANYLFAIAGIQRLQKLPLGMSLFAKLDGQMSDQPLIDNEQYAAGGIESVRGYKESESLGDNALHGTLEVSFPNPFEKLNVGKWFQATPFVFYDIAKLTIRDPLPGQDRTFRLDGTGAGMRGSIVKNVEYEFDWAVALHDTDKIKKYAQSIYFKLKTLL